MISRCFFAQLFTEAFFFFFFLSISVLCPIHFLVLIREKNKSACSCLYFHIHSSPLPFSSISRSILCPENRTSRNIGIRYQGFEIKSLCIMLLTFFAVFLFICLIPYSYFHSLFPYFTLMVHGNLNSKSR